MVKSIVFDVFRACTRAVQEGVLISRASRRDKEFHFQDWVGRCLQQTPYHFDQGGRNTYPDFSAVEVPEGIEVKGLAYPGREANYDCNSQVPSGKHNARTIYYIFGRYPSEPDGNTYPVLDLVLCHGDFLNAHHDYQHKNRNVKGFGTYGDIMIRDRKMYVAPTPYGLLEGVAHSLSLVLPTDLEAPEDFGLAARITRIESTDLVVAYTFDLTTNEIAPRTLPNPNAGREHTFNVWRLNSSSGCEVRLKT